MDNNTGQEKPTCIICLSSEPETYAYKGTCNCTPSVHIKCLDEWYKTNNKSCPICKKRLVIPSSEVNEAVRQRDRDIWICCASCTIVSFMYLPVILTYCF